MLTAVEPGAAVVACNTCRHSADAQNDAAGVRGGARLVEALRGVQASDARYAGVAVQEMPCLFACEDFCTVHLRAPGKVSYVLGRFLGTSAPKKVALFAGSLSYRGHEEREMGFRHILAEEFPNLQIVELREMLDDREKAFAEASALLDRHGDLAGIYNIGAGNQGIARALKQRGRFAVVKEPVISSGRKARLHSPAQVLWISFKLLVKGPKAWQRREGLEFWYDGRREAAEGPPSRA